ncbi:sugar phosphate isomerase/epimerase family protein [Pseudalkalibacillus salsuginis]|uniref:sugar phosphate isomerase/epimerase family protein n=1 Tax=Pseudalkalibacillus salsuginis TaxID=2910972 RepID=UPI001F167ECD|nr:sugar phosphate isomerase/epimerase family protein [Pseudalkalibacillus salsuginis]MCF6409521.1 sugar phosphate isomerase/epimerase [Pseudalkalibacillus salsuginis]
MNKGINAWCFPESYSIEDIFKSARDHGYEGVELNLSDDPFAPLPLNLKDKDLMDIKLKALDAGLSLPSLSTDLLWKCPLTDEDANIRQKGLAIVEEMIRMAVVFEADTVLVVPGVVNEHVSYEKAYGSSQESLRKLLPLAEKAGITIGIENVWNKFLLSPLEMRQFVDEFKSPNIGVYFDAGNVYPFGFPEDWIRILSDRIKSVHVKDFKASVGNANGFVPLLAGDIKWNRVTDALEEIGYEGFVIPEIPPHQHFHQSFIGNLADTMDEIFPFKR